MKTSLEFVVLSAQATTVHEGKLASFYQGGGQVLYDYTAGLRRGKCKIWQYLEPVGNVFKLNKANGGQLFTASAVYFYFVRGTLLSKVL